MVVRRKHEELIVWQRAMDFVDAVYDLTEDWPARETYGMTNQIRRASVSVPANIAEGQGRTGTNEFLYQLSIAYGSLMETQTLIQVGRRRRFSAPQDCEKALLLSDEVARLLLATIASLRRRRTQA